MAERIKRTYELEPNVVAALDQCARQQRVAQSRMVQWSLIYVLSRVESGDLVLPLAVRVRELDMRAAHVGEDNTQGV